MESININIDDKRKDIMKYILFFFIIAGIIFLAIKSGKNQIFEDTTVKNALHAKDSALGLNEKLQHKIIVDSTIILEKEERIIEINQEAEEWKKRYKAMTYKHKVLVAEGIVGGHIIIKDGLACFTERQLDSVALIARERKELTEVLDEMMDVIDLKDSMMFGKNLQIKNLEFAVDTMGHAAIKINVKYINEVNKNLNCKKKVKKVRKRWFITGIIAFGEGVVIYVQNKFN